MIKHFDKVETQLIRDTFHEKVEDGTLVCNCNGCLLNFHRRIADNGEERSGTQGWRTVVKHMKNVIKKRRYGHVPPLKAS